MSRRRSKAKPKAPATPIEALETQVNQASGGVPVFLPTPERARMGDLAVEQVSTWQHRGYPLGSEPPRRVTAGFVVRDRTVNARARLSRFRDLTEDQIAAGVRLEADWQGAGLEPRVVANLLGTGGGKGAAIVDMKLDAKTRVHFALQVLQLAGDETVRIVRAIIIEGATSVAAGAGRYADAEKGRVHVAAHLSAGLNMLVGHYRTAARVGSERAARARVTARQRVKERH